MKNKYFGDINDYRKYGILRILSDLKILVCWMLTADDNRSDGKFINYLQNSKKFRHFDEHLFDTLKLTLEQQVRHTSNCETVRLIPNASYYSKLLTDNVLERDIYFSELYEKAANYDLVFLDPDNGLEVHSVKKGNRNSSRYLYYEEVERLYRGGSSLMIYQHFIREERDAFIKRISGKLKIITGAPEIFHLKTSNVVFFIVSTPGHVEYFNKMIPQISNTWKKQIILSP